MCDICRDNYMISAGYSLVDTHPYLYACIFVGLILMFWHRETHTNPRRNRTIIVDPAGIEVATSKTEATPPRIYDDVMKWKHFPRNWPLLGDLMFSLICAWINGWVNNRGTGDLRRHRAHYYVTAMYHILRPESGPHFAHRVFNCIFAKWIYLVLIFKLL